MFPESGSKHDQTPEKSSRPSSETAEAFEPKEEAAEKPVTNEEDATEEYSHGLRLAALVVSLLLGMFLVALDNTILGTAIPKITDQFHDLNKVAWYGSVCCYLGDIEFK